MHEMTSCWLLGNGEGTTEKISEFIKYIIVSQIMNQDRVSCTVRHHATTNEPSFPLTFAYKNIIV